MADGMGTKRAHRDTSSGVGLDVTVTLPVEVLERIGELAKERGETAAGWCRAELIALVEAPGSDGRIRAVLDAATAAERRVAAGRLTDASIEGQAGGCGAGRTPMSWTGAMDVKNTRGMDAGAGVASVPSTKSGTGLHEATRNPVG